MCKHSRCSSCINFTAAGVDVLRLIRERTDILLELPPDFGGRSVTEQMDMMENLGFGRADIEEAMQMTSNNAELAIRILIRVSQVFTGPELMC